MLSITPHPVVTMQVKQLQDNEPQCTIYIVATKADQLAGGSGGDGRKPAVSSAEVQKFASSIQAAIHSTSAKSGQGIAVSDADACSFFSARQRHALVPGLHTQPCLANLSMQTTLHRQAMLHGLSAAAADTWTMLQACVLPRLRSLSIF